MSPTRAAPSAALFDFYLAPCFTAAMRFDLLIKNGLLVDPAQNLRAPYDVAIKRNRVAAIDRDIPPESAARVIDAAGQIVTPGLVNLHAHV